MYIKRVSILARFFILKKNNFYYNIPVVTRCFPLASANGQANGQDK